MNPAFWGIVIIVLIVIWFLMSFSFKSVGKFFRDLWRNITGKDDFE